MSTQKAILVGISCLGMLSSDFAFAYERDRFDFFCKDGQHLRNAVVEQENDAGYFVTMAYLPDRIFISRQNLSAPPKMAKRSVSEQTSGKMGAGVADSVSKLSFGVAGGIGNSFLFLSSLGSVFKGTYFFSGGLFLLFRRPFLKFIEGLQLNGMFTEYRNDLRYIKITSGYGGFRFLWTELKFLRMKLFTDVSAGIAHMDLKGFIFSESVNSLTLNSKFGVSFNPAPLFFSAGVSIDYYHDYDVNFTPVALTAQTGIVF